MNMWPRKKNILDVVISLQSTGFVIKVDSIDAEAYSTQRRANFLVIGCEWNIIHMNRITIDLAWCWSIVSLIFVINDKFTYSRPPR